MPPAGGAPAQAGSGSPSSFRRSKSANISPPPALSPETILGALQCHAYLMLAEMTMCYTGTLPLDEDGEDEDQPEDWQQ